jgi:Domain of unknown function (DUF5680)
VLPRDALVRFLMEAKHRTHAAQGDDATVAPCRPAPSSSSTGRVRCSTATSTSASRRLAGLELVYEGDGPVWSMAYAGGIVSEGADTRAVYSLLRAALRRIEPAEPFRGPARYVEEGWVYTNDVAGDVARWTAGVSTRWPMPAGW